MRKTLFLHIGQTKTGSTSLQRFLQVNRVALAGRGVHYPPCVAARHNHRHLFTALQQAGGSPALAAPAWQATLDDIAQQAAPVAVISSELLWHLFAGREAARRRALRWLAHTLAGVDVRVVCYLRAQDSWVEAMYNQLVKSGQLPAGTLRFNEFLGREHTAGLMDYAGMLAPWAEAFGAGALVVRAFERHRLAGGDVVDDFMSLVGLADLSGLRRLPDAQARLSWPVCELLTAFNRVPALRESREEFVALLSGLVGPQPAARLLDAAGIAALRERYAVGNAFVARTWCGRDALFEPASPASPEPVYQGLSATEWSSLVVKTYAAAQPVRRGSGAPPCGRSAGSAAPGPRRCVPHRG